MSFCVSMVNPDIPQADAYSVINQFLLQNTISERSGAEMGLLLMLPLLEDKFSDPPH